MTCASRKAMISNEYAKNTLGKVGFLNSVFAKHAILDNPYLARHPFPRLVRKPTL